MFEHAYVTEYSQTQSSWLINIKTRFKISFAIFTHPFRSFSLRIPLQTFISSKQSTIQSNAKSINRINNHSTNFSICLSIRPNLEQKDQQQAEKNEKIPAREISLSWREKSRRESRPVSRLVIIEGKISRVEIRFVEPE